ncbi:MAG: hypothetical protein JWM68_142 [Verrucomicrobiales bacterium]|nr:hypothetical protein [Verrucomicrobiales bacterium]
MWQSYDFEFSIERPNAPGKIASATTNAPVASSDAPTENGVQSIAPLPSRKADGVIASGLNSTAVAVVDLDRLVAAQLSGGDSQAARESIVRNTKQLIAQQATTRGFALVFDTSGKSAHGTPFVLVTNGVPDITDEVLKLLTR